MTRAILLAAATLGDEPPEWLLILFPFLFVGMWFLVGTILGNASGHTQLLSRFPPVDEPRAKTFSGTSGRVGPISFSGALYVGVGERGLHLAAHWLFRPILHRGIPCIPWREIRLVSTGPTGLFGLFKGSKFEIRSLGLAFSLMGEAGRAVERKLAEVDGKELPPSRPLVR